MLTVKEAFGVAQEWVRHLYAESELKHLRLEEVELSDDERYWNITLGWAEPAIRENAFATTLSSGARVLPRVYKRLEVDVETGAVKSMTDPGGCLMPISGFLPGDEEARNERYRRMPISEKLECIAELNRLEDERRRADIRVRYGSLSEREMRLRLAAPRLGRELMKKAFGWDPDEKG